MWKCPKYQLTFGSSCATVFDTKTHDRTNPNTKKKAYKILVLVDSRTGQQIQGHGDPLKQQFTWKLKQSFGSIKNLKKCKRLTKWQVAKHFQGIKTKHGKSFRIAPPLFHSI